MPSSIVDEQGVGHPEVDREVDSVCPYCGVGCQITYHIKDDKIRYVTGRNGPANENRLCVKGRFGFDYVAHPRPPDEAADPQGRRAQGRRRPRSIRAIPGPISARRAGRRRSSVAASGPARRSATATARDALAGFGSAKGSNEEAYLFQKLVRTGFGTNNVDHCTRLCHASSVAALMENIGIGRGHRAVHRRARRRRDHRDRRQPDREPPGRRDLLQAGGQARHDADRHGPARPGARSATPPTCCSSSPAPTSRMLNAHHARDRRGGALRPPVHPGAHRGLRAPARRTSRTSRPRPWRAICGIAAETLRDGRAHLRPRRARHHVLGHGHHRSTSTAPTTPAA